MSVTAPVNDKATIIQVLPNEVANPLVQDKTEHRVGMGPVEHVGKQGGRRRFGVIGSMVLTSVAAFLLATTPLAAQTNGAPLDNIKTEVSVVNEAKLQAPQDAQWLKFDLEPEQVVVSRFDTGKKRLAGKVHIAVPWPDDAPRDIDNVEMFVFAKDDAVDFRIEGDTLHLSYVSEMGLRQGLQDHNGVFQLHMKDGVSHHLLSFDSDKLTFDDRQITLEQLRDRIPTLERMIEVYTEHERNRVPGRYDDYGMSSSESAKRELKLVRQQISDIKSGKAKHRSVY